MSAEDLEMLHVLIDVFVSLDLSPEQIAKLVEAFIRTHM